MRVVADTNVMVSALLWEGLPHRLLIAAETGRMVLYTSLHLVEELAGVLARPKLAAKLRERQTTTEELIIGYLKLAHLIVPETITPVIKEDPDDDAVLACALAARVAFVVTGDQHLLRLKSYHRIQMVSPKTLLSTLF